jgi:hypothetical protein
MPFDNDTSLAQLVQFRDAAEAEMQAAKRAVSDLNERIKSVAAPLLLNGYERAGKHDGTIRFVSGNHQFKCEVGKRVTWDSGLLAALAAQMDPREAALLFKVDYSVPEAQFKGITDTALRHNLTQARTVKYAEPKITLAD